MRTVAAAILAMALTACGANERRSEGAATQAAIENSADTQIVPPRSPSPAPAATPTPLASATRYLGRWTGVEGMYLVVRDPAQGAVTLEMQYDLDHKGEYAGTVTPEGIRFQRGDAVLTLRPTDGDATGLKWLAGKRNCLTVRAGEGYCRD